jgi:hypothetical protein
MNKIINDKYEFLIVGNHPHAGDRCNLLVSENNKMLTVGDGTMFLFHLINCSHGEMDYVACDPKSLVLIKENGKDVLKCYVR